MSYSTQDAQLHQTEIINQAIKERDEEKLYTLAQYAKGDGEDELADYLVQQARRIYREDWAYDESINN